MLGIGKGFTDSYGKLCKRFIEHGAYANATMWFECNPRGMPIIERLGGSMIVEDSTRRLLYNPSRRLNLVFACAETLWNLKGMDCLETVAFYNSRMRLFSDDGKTLRSSYGGRLRGRGTKHVGFQHDQLLEIIKTLERDRDSRQAIAVFRSSGELKVNTKDQICGCSVQFFIRNDQLHLVVHFRSSDIWLGVPYDYFWFSILQQVVAIALDVEVGTFTHLAGSLHLYQKDFDAARTMINEPQEGRMISQEIFPTTFNKVRGKFPDGQNAMIAFDRCAELMIFIDRYFQSLESNEVFDSELSNMHRLVAMEVENPWLQPMMELLAPLLMYQFLKRMPTGKAVHRIKDVPLQVVEATTEIFSFLAPAWFLRRAVSFWRDDILKPIPQGE